MQDHDKINLTEIDGYQSLPRDTEENANFRHAISEGRTIIGLVYSAGGAKVLQITADMRWSRLQREINGFDFIIIGSRIAWSDEVTQEDVRQLSKGGSLLTEVADIPKVQCPNPKINTAIRGNRFQPWMVPCGRKSCDVCGAEKKVWLVRHLDKVAPEIGHSLTISSEKWDAMVKKLKRHGIDWFAIPLPNGSRIMFLANKIDDATEVDRETWLDQAFLAEDLSKKRTASEPWKGWTNETETAILDETDTEDRDIVVSVKLDQLIENLSVMQWSPEGMNIISPASVRRELFQHGLVIEAEARTTAWYHELRSYGILALDEPQAVRWPVAS